MPFEAGSPQLLPALLSTKPLPAEFVRSIALPFPAGGSVFPLCEEKMAGNNSCDWKSEGLSEGRNGIQARLEGCALSVDWDLRRGIFYGRRCFWKYFSCWDERGSIYWGGDCSNIFGVEKGGGGSGEGNGGDGGGGCGFV